MYWVVDFADGRRFRQVDWVPSGYNLYMPGIAMVPGCEVDLQEGHHIPGISKFHLYGEREFGHVHFILDYENGTRVADHLARGEGGSTWKWKPFGALWNPALGRLYFRSWVGHDVGGGRVTVQVGRAPLQLVQVGIRYDDWWFVIRTDHAGRLLKVMRERPDEPVIPNATPMIIGSCFDTLDTPGVERLMVVPDDVKGAPGLPIHKRTETDDGVVSE